MLTYLSLALALLKFVNFLMMKAHEGGLIQQGYDKAIAEITQSILIKTTAGKAIMEKVNAMSDADVDAGLVGLEPK